MSVPIPFPPPPVTLPPRREPSTLPPINTYNNNDRLSWPDAETNQPGRQVFGNLVDNCFNACVDDFTSRALSGRESGCISRCVTKSMTTQTRLAERFAELNASMTAEMQKRYS
jgi:hypothetical protein